MDYFDLLIHEVHIYISIHIHDTPFLEKYNVCQDSSCRMAEARRKIKWRYAGDYMKEKWQEKGSVLGEHEKKALYDRGGHSDLCIIIKNLFQIKISFPTGLTPHFRNSPLHHILQSLAVSLCLLTVFPISWLVCLPCHSVSFPNSGFLMCESQCSKQRLHVPTLK